MTELSVKSGAPPPPLEHAEMLKQMIEILKICLIKTIIPLYFMIIFKFKRNKFSFFKKIWFKRDLLYSHP